MNWYDEVDFHPENEVVLKLGSTGDEVFELQRLLKSRGYAVGVDGDFGPNTLKAVQQLQRDSGLVVDGLVGSKTLEYLKLKHPDPRFLSQADIEAAAVSLAVPTPAVMAVSEVESRGQGFFSNGRPAILFERHIFRRRLIAHGIDPNPIIKEAPDLCNTKSGGYKGGVAEYDRLERAMKYHPTAALESCSWGAYQIMGYHWEALGYDSVHDFVDRMNQREAEHLEAFVRFIKADSVLHTALKALDWTGFARRYNGRNYAKNAYDKKMAEAYTMYVGQYA